jgi:hypothetical protein
MREGRHPSQQSDPYGHDAASSHEHDELQMSFHHLGQQEVRTEEWFLVEVPEDVRLSTRTQRMLGEQQVQMQEQNVQCHL